MKKILASLAVAGFTLSPAAALAQDAAAVPAPDQTFLGVDTDRNGGVSWAEFSLIFTDYNEQQFNAADLNADGQLSQEEFDSIVLATGSIGSDTGADLDVGVGGKSLTDTTTE
jgi:hypothetical protein